MFQTTLDMYIGLEEELNHGSLDRYSVTTNINSLVICVETGSEHYLCPVLENCMLNVVMFAKR